jgi:hypothetical protein
MKDQNSKSRKEAMLTLFLVLSRATKYPFIDERNATFDIRNSIVHTQILSKR